MKIFNHPRHWKKANPRHWITIVIAVASLVVGIIAFANFSGEPDPWWRSILTKFLPPLTISALAITFALDKRDRDCAKAQATTTKTVEGKIP